MPVTIIVIVATVGRWVFVLASESVACKAGFSLSVGRTNERGTHAENYANPR